MRVPGFDLGLYFSRTSTSNQLVELKVPLIVHTVIKNIFILISRLTTKIFSNFEFILATSIN